MVKQVEIFKTNVNKKNDSEVIVRLMTRHFSYCKVNFDLEDCDHILRVEAPVNKINKKEIIHFMRKQGFTCLHLP